MPFEILLSWLQSAAVQQNLIALVIAVSVEGARRWLTPAERLVWGLTHGFTFRMPNAAPAEDSSAPQSGGTELRVEVVTLFLSNEGRGTAEEVEIHLNYKPTHFQLWPTFEYTTRQLPEGHFIIRLPNLGQKEKVSLEMLHVAGQMPWVLRVRSKRCEASAAKLEFFKVYPRWVQLGMAALFLLGAFTVIRFVLYLVFLAAT